MTGEATETLIMTAIMIGVALDEMILKRWSMNGGEVESTAVLLIEPWRMILAMTGGVAMERRREQITWI